jgi:hypothetical protein
MSSMVLVVPEGMRRECLDSVNKGQEQVLTNRNPEWPQLAWFRRWKLHALFEHQVCSFTPSHISKRCLVMQDSTFPNSILTVTGTRVSVCTFKSTNKKLQNMPSIVQVFLGYSRSNLSIQACCREVEKEINKTLAC